LLLQIEQNHRWDSVRVTSDSHSHVNVVVDWPPRLRGRVVNERGNAITKFTLDDETFHASDGRFEIDLPSETLEAWAIQRRIFALSHRRLLIAATSGRLILITRKLIGGLSSHFSTREPAGFIA